MADKEFIVSLLLKLNDALTKPLGRVNEKNAKALKEMGEKWQKVGGTMTKTITAPFLLLSGLAVKTAGDFEKYTQSFSTMLKSEERGAQFVKDLRDFSARTPLQFGDLASGAEMMLAFNIQSKNVLPYLKMIGDVARGDAGKMSQLTLAFSQMHSTGRLMGQDLLQMINAGFNPLAVISEKTGKSIGQLKKEMEKGAISTEMVTQAFKDATSEGGMFYNAMEKQSKTFLGRLSTLKDNLGIMLGKIGEMLYPFVNKLMEFAQGFINFFSKLDDGTKGILLAFIAIAAAAGPTIALVGKLIKTFSAGFTPMHGFLLAITALVAALAFIHEQIKKSYVVHEENAKKIGEEVKETKDLENRYNELSKKTNLNAKEKIELARVEKILKERIGETAFVIDEQTGKLVLNTEAAKKYYEKRRKEMLLELVRQKNLFKENVRMLKVYIEERQRLGAYGVQAPKSLAEQLGFRLMGSDEDLADVLTEWEDKMFGIDQQIASMTEEMDGAGKATDEVGDKMDKLGKQEETPLLQIPTKMRKIMQSIKVDTSTPKALQAVATSNSKASVTIKIETDKGSKATVKKIEKSGPTDLKVKTGSSLAPLRYY